MLKRKKKESDLCKCNNYVTQIRKEMFYLTMLLTHFIYGIWRRNYG